MFARWWNGGLWQKVALLAAIPLLLSCMCCSGTLVFGMTPYGQQIVAEGEATDTAQAIANIQATATTNAYLLAHPTATATATDTPVPTITPLPTATATPLPTATPKPAPTATPRPPAPTATPKPSCSYGGAPPNPWCFTFNYTGKLIYSPPSAFCSYFDCIPSFWTSTNGYVEQCMDGAFSHSGGRSGSCSYHGGNKRPLYQH